MMQHKPMIIVETLFAKKGNKVVYNENFHEGVNVLSGCNGGGKTSVLQLLAFGLGYEVNNWKDEAGQCDYIYVGLKINGEPITVRRQNRHTEKQSMDICYMPFDDAIDAPIEEWSNYPYSITSSRESFSQKLFSLLGIPETKVDSNNNNITIHQIFRLIYSDQSSDPGCIFNVEPFDSAFKRESVGNYLLGLYDNDLYDAKISLVIEEKKLDKVVAKLQAIFSVVGKTSFAKEFGTLEEARASYLSEISKINLEIQDVKQAASISYVNEKDATENHAFESIKIKSKLLECESDIQVLNYEIEDSNDFLAELMDKTKSIEDSINVGTKVPEITFELCPGCHQKLEPKPHDCCQLCGSKNELDGSESSVNLLRMKNEINIQIRESDRILKKKESKLSALLNEKKSFRTLLRQKISKVSSTMTSLNSSDEGVVYEAYRKIGEVEEKIATLEKIKELHRSIAELSDERSSTQEEVNRLQELIELKKYQYVKRDPEIKSIISTHLINILRQDVGAEKEFNNAETVYFDFASNTISINGKSAFSESGTVYLNNAFHLALLVASLDKEYLRIPRFMILDGIENGGMEDVRSKNFQKVMKEYLEQYSTAYQLIFATKSICPDLDNKDYIVGEKFSKDNKSLDF